MDRLGRRCRAGTPRDVSGAVEHLGGERPRVARGQTYWCGPGRIAVNPAWELEDVRYGQHGTRAGLSPSPGLRRTPRAPTRCSGMDDAQAVSGSGSRSSASQFGEALSSTTISSRWAAASQGGER